MKTNPTCRVCRELLNSDNWTPGQKKNYNYICKECRKEQSRLYVKANPEKVRSLKRAWIKANPEKATAMSTRASRKRGALPMSENKECSSYFGVYIGEPLLYMIFKNVERMPYGHPGYDIICGNDKKIDVKLSSLRKSQNNWQFHIRRNTTADYFWCVAFDNRKDLNIIHIWLLPGDKFNHLANASISPSTIHKWDAYKQDPTKVIACCDTMKAP